VTSNALDSFSPPVRAWFREKFGEPTPPQAQGWLPIQRGEHTLILAPTGSGKTLAAFLWGIDRLYSIEQTGKLEQKGVRLLYISPLKALNNDIERNLRVPLEGIRETAARLGEHLPSLRVAVRTGDTPSHVRTAMWKNPPHILITTPESLFLMLTSPRARDMFQTVGTVIVDEIHTLVGTKRGTHLALSLERLEHHANEHVQRIGLSATIKPLEEAARFLGGQTQSPVSSLQSPGTELQSNPAISYSPRPVTIVNATYNKALDLRVVTVVDDFSSLPGTTIWPAVIPHVLNDIRRHNSTLIFCNNRRLAERTADRLNAQLDAEQKEEIEPGSMEALAPGGLARDRGIFAIGAEGPIRAHHGSMSKQARRKMEEDLKAGRLPALVGTSSLELGIDIGAVDLVVQLQSPKSVAQGLQRVGRSGHLVGETSVGRIYATFREDLVEAAAITRGMLEGDVEPTFSPENPLDVLAQQIVAMVASDEWDVHELYNLVRRAYPYRDLSEGAFESVLEMLSGKYDFPGEHGPAPLRARISWDRVNQRLRALPGSRLLAMMNSGTISDTGAFGVYLSDGKTKVGELDEEFVFETRPGDVFLLGSHVWRALDITDDRVVVGDAAGATPRMPFWNGDYPYRPYELGARIGRFRREIAERIGAGGESTAQLAEWLQREYHLDEKSAQNLIAYVQRQLDAIGVMSSDQTIVVETFQDAVGEPRMVIHSPYGGRVNGAWALALTSVLKERVGIDIETQTNDDGILFRFPSTSEPPVDPVLKLTPQEARERILRELPNSALFGAHFRMNAARALLLPKARGRKRTPFWLQRLKAKDLMARVRKFQDFPIVAETYRDCLRDVLDLPHLEEVLAKIQGGEIHITPIETIVPSPVAAGLLFQFVSVYMYEWDAPKAERQLQTLAAQRDLFDDIVHGAELLKPDAVEEVVARVQRTADGYRARSAEELAVILGELGDLTNVEIMARCVGDAHSWIAQLAEQKRIIEISIPTRRGEDRRWIPAESPLRPPLKGWERGEIGESVLRRFLSHSGPVTRDDILDRYAYDPAWLDETLQRLVASRDITQQQIAPAPSASQFCDRHLFEQFYRHTLTLLRREIQPVSLSAYADFLVRWQHLHPSERLHDATGLRAVLEQLRGSVVAEKVWEREILPARITNFALEDFISLCASGELVWQAQKNRLRLFFRGEGGLFVVGLDDSSLEQNARSVYEFLKSEGASFLTDIENGLLLKRTIVTCALSELALAGWVTNDSLEALDAVADAHQPKPMKYESPLEVELASRMQYPRALTTSRYRDTKRRVARRLRAETPSSAWTGRWSILRRTSILGPTLADDERAEKLARVLLARYGVVTHESLDREDLSVDWGMLYLQFQRMEMRGEIRRGYFVKGLSGIQFAHPDAVDRLRAQPDDAMTVVNASDPANIYGGELPDAPRFPRLPSTHCVLWRGRPILVAEENGDRIIVQEAEQDIIRRALRAYLERVNAPRHCVIKEWNGVGVHGSSGEPLLQSFGFSRTPSGMEK
jgi:ATP-dependent helicase Lhr and Lhr-like helicase